MTASPDVVMVVCRSGDQVAVWQVVTGTGRGLSRLAGAWVLARTETHVIDALLRRRWVLGLTGGAHVVEAAEVAILGYVDPGATLAGIRAEVVELQDRFDGEPRPKRRKLVAPDWPVVPAAFDPASFAGADAPAEVALAVGRWVADVADAWQRIETERMARPFLIAPAGPLVRTLPIRGRAISAVEL